MNQLEAEAIVWQRRQQPGRNFEKDHSMDECVDRLLGYPQRRLALENYPTSARMPEQKG